MVYFGFGVSQGVIGAMRILVVEDDDIVAAGLREALENGGFASDRVASAEPAEGALTLTAYDLAIVDLGLPGMDGHELVRRLRRKGVSVPVLILTARDNLEDRVKGLDIGADDYLTKPFMIPELLSRIRAIIRRGKSASSSDFQYGRLQINLTLYRAALDGIPIELTRREWDLFEHLVLAAPYIVKKQKLIESLSQWDNEITSNAIEILMSRLRAKLEGSGLVIRTVRGIGYQLDET
jgi:DNA-binding response OmpR family regulator